MQSEQLSQLHGILASQGDVLSALLAVARRQQQAIIERDRACVEATTREQDELFAALQSLEYDRMQLQHSLSAGADGAVAAPAQDRPVESAADATPESLSSATADKPAGGSSSERAGTAAHDPGLGFERLLRTLPEQQSLPLADARDKARTLLLELTSVNRTNQQLLAQELVMFELYMNVLNPDMSGEVYSEPGQARRATGSAAVAFDARI